jgi:hypothetical protein
MLPLGIQLNHIEKINKMIFTTLPFNMEEQLLRDSKIFGMKIDIKKNKSRKTNKKNGTKKNNLF